ncbi:MAG: hypothetical protein OCC49_08530 [Fibrobacterales bacterium]
MSGYGEILASYGRIEVMREGSVEWQLITTGDKVLHNDRVRSFKASGCTIQFLDSSSVELQSASGLLYNNSISEKSEVVERIFSNVYGVLEFSFSQKSIKGEAHNWVKLKGLEVQTLSSLLSVVSDSAQVEVVVKKESVWVKGKHFKESLTLKGHKIVYNPLKGTGVIEPIPEYFVPELIAMQDEVVFDKGIDLSKEKLVLSKVVLKGDSVMVPSRWDVAALFVDLQKSFFKGRTAELLVSDREQFDPATLSSQYKGATMLFTTVVESFKVTVVGKEFRVSLFIDNRLFNAESGYEIVSIPFTKRYSVPVSDNNNMKILKYLPLEQANKRIALSVLNKCFKDYLKQLEIAVENPL